VRATILAAALLVSVCSFQDAAPPKPERLYLASVYGEPFDTLALPGVRRVKLIGTVADGESVLFGLDNNACDDLGPFGDDGSCTERGGWFRLVRLTRVRAKDPHARGRQLFLLDDADLGGRLLIVSEDDDGHGWRLIQRDADGKVSRVLSLEQRPMPPHLKEDDDERP